MIADNNRSALKLGGQKATPNETWLTVFGRRISRALALLIVLSLKCLAQDEIVFRECFQKPPQPLFLWHKGSVFPEGELKGGRITFQRLAGSIAIDVTDTSRKDRVWEVELEPTERTVLKINLPVPKGAKVVEIHYNLRAELKTDTEVFEVSDSFSFDGKRFIGHGGGRSGKEWRTWMSDRDVETANADAVSRNRGRPIPAGQLYTSERDGKRGGVPSLASYSKIPAGAKSIGIQLSVRGSSLGSKLVFDDFVVCILRSDRSFDSKIQGRGR